MVKNFQCKARSCLRRSNLSTTLLSLQKPKKSSWRKKFQMRISWKHLRSNRSGRWGSNFERIKRADNDRPETKKMVFKRALTEVCCLTPKTNSFRLRSRNWIPKWTEIKLLIIVRCPPWVTTSNMISMSSTRQTKIGCPRVHTEPCSKTRETSNFCKIAVDKWPKELKCSKIKWANEWNIKINLVKF